MTIYGNIGFDVHYFAFLVFHAVCTEIFEPSCVSQFPLNSYALRDNGFI